jgi:hypothetical protein
VAPFVYGDIPYRDKHQIVDCDFPVNRYFYRDNDFSLRAAERNP